MKNLFSIVFIMMAFSSKSQYTITSAMNPVPGDIESYFSIDTTGITVSAPGTGQTWNYPVVITNTTAFSTTYAAVSAAPFFTLYPSANLALDGGGGSTGYYDMYQYNSTGVTYFGNTGPTYTDCAAFSDPALMNSLPFTYGSASSDSYSVSSSSLGYNETGTVTANGDASGTLILGSITYSNVIRLKRKIDFYGVSGTTNYFGTTTHYHFYSSASKFPLARIEISNQVFGSSTYYNKITLLNYIVPTALNEKEKRPGKLSVYPNPANTDFVEITAEPSSKNQQILLINSLGQKIRSFYLEAESKNIKVEISDLPQGIYFLKTDSGAPVKLVVE